MTNNYKILGEGQNNKITRRILIIIHFNLVTTQIVSLGTAFNTGKIQGQRNDKININ